MRTGLESQVVQACRVRESTRSVYLHAQEQLFRAERAIQDCQQGSATWERWRDIISNLEQAISFLRAANVGACDQARMAQGPG